MKPQIKAFSWLLLFAIGLFPTIQYAQPVNLNQDSTSTIITVSDPNFFLDAYRTIKSIVMYNTTGVRLYEHSFIPGQPVSLYQVDIAPYESGMYFIRTVFSDTSSTIHRFVKL